MPVVPDAVIPDNRAKGILFPLRPLDLFDQFPESPGSLVFRQKRLAMLMAERPAPGTPITDFKHGHYPPRVYLPTY